ncbi:MAG TPA: CbtB-domain containing protein [Microcoleaceae cyanobacterium]|jgi:hypothetical protein
MTTQSLSLIRQQAIRFTLSVPVQATLYVSLCSLVLWTVYFTTYPAAHDRVHSLRHHTAAVACH